MSIDEQSELYAALARLAAVPRILVAADFDGTLAPLVEDPMSSRAVDGATQALERLAALDGVTVALVSGRDLPTLTTLASLGAGGAPVVLVGSHGAHTSLDAPGDASLDAGAAEVLAAVTADLERLAAERGARLERKPTSAVLHTRGMDPAGAREALAAAREVSGRHTGLFVTPGKEVLELAVVETSKGAALRRLAADRELAACAYFGDDVTDETAFAALTGPDDVTVKVGAGETAARYRVPDERAVLAALRHLGDARAG